MKVIQHILSIFIKIIEMNDFYPDDFLEQAQEQALSFH